MRLIVRAFLFFSISLILASCNVKDSGIKIASTEDVQQMIDEEQTPIS